MLRRTAVASVDHAAVYGRRKTGETPSLRTSLSTRSFAILRGTERRITNLRKDMTLHKLAPVFSRSVSVLTLGFALLAGELWAQERPAGGANSTKNNVSHADGNFFQKAAASGMEELAISKAVVERLSQESVRQFARTMIDDHSKVNRELAALATQKAVSLPEADEKIDGVSKTWSQKTKDVDKEYLSKMVSDHKAAVEVFQKGATSHDRDIAQFAQGKLPTLEHHLSEAKKLLETLQK
jgi:putative membrane protein